MRRIRSKTEKRRKKSEFSFTGMRSQSKRACEYSFTFKLFFALAFYYSVIFSINYFDFISTCKRNGQKHPDKFTVSFVVVVILVRVLDFELPKRRMKA